MDPKTFEELRTLIEKRYTALFSVAVLSPEYLSEKGKLDYEVFDELDDIAVFESVDLETFVNCVAEKIRDYSTCKFTPSPEVPGKLRKFVRVNVSKEIWKDIPEFASRKENK